MKTQMTLRTRICRNCRMICDANTRIWWDAPDKSWHRRRTTSRWTTEPRGSPSPAIRTFRTTTERQSQRDLPHHRVQKRRLSCPESLLPSWTDRQCIRTTQATSSQLITTFRRAIRTSCSSKPPPHSSTHKPPRQDSATGCHTISLICTIPTCPAIAIRSIRGSWAVTVGSSRTDSQEVSRTFSVFIVLLHPKKKTKRWSEQWAARLISQPSDTPLSHLIKNYLICCESISTSGVLLSSSFFMDFRVALLLPGAASKETFHFFTLVFGSDVHVNYPMPTYYILLFCNQTELKWHSKSVMISDRLTEVLIWKKKRNEKSRAVSRKQNIFPRVRDGSESSEGLNEWLREESS